MPPDILFQGILIPAGAALAWLVVGLAIAQLLDPARTGGGGPGRSGSARGPAVIFLAAGLRALFAATALAVAAALSFHARQGLAFPPPSAWEWKPWAIGAVAILATIAAPGEARALSGVRVAVVSILAGAALAWFLVLPEQSSPAWRAATGAVGAIACALVLTAPPARPSGLLCGLAFTCFGVAAASIGAGFEKLFTILCGAGVASLGAAAVALVAPRVPWTATFAPVAAAFLVAATAIGHAYTDRLPSWNWAAVLLPIVALRVAPRLLPRDAPWLQAFGAPLAAGVVAFAVGALVLAPRILRGEFPP